MITIYKAIASCCGIGYLKGGGTLAALVTSIGWYYLIPREGAFWQMCMLTLGVVMIGLFTSSKVEKDWGKDSSKVVIDEVAGMCIGLLFIPVSLNTIGLGLLLFRVFDITKPFYIRRMESLPGGWGVMMDDVLAGIYTNLVLQGLLLLNII